MKIVPGAICLIALGLVTLPAGADTTCTAPDAPVVPASFANITEAETTETAVQTWLLALSEYQKCLAEERSTLGADITAEQDAELAGLKSVASTEARSIAETYNSAVIELHLVQ